MKPSAYHQVLRFIAVGVVNTAIDLAVLNVLIAATDRGRSGIVYLLFKAVSFTCATTNSYFLNRHWTFAGASGGKAVERQALEFAVVSVLGLIVNVTAATSFVAVVPVLVVSEKLWPSVGALFGTCCSLVTNFFGYKFFVFKRSGV
jgi:putative flippase GtrA